MKFEQVRDHNGTCVPKLWKRGERLYAALTIPGKGTRRVPLRTPDKHPVSSLTEARAALVVLEYELAQGTQIAGDANCPTLADFTGAYLETMERTKAKDPKTISKEACHLRRWTETTGAVKLDKLGLSHITRHVAARLKSPVISNRTVNLDLVALGNLLRFAKSEGLVRRVVTDDWTPLRHKAPAKRLLTVDEVASFCAACHAYDGAACVADFVKLAAYTGARFASLLALEWSDVDFVRRTVNFHRATKYARSITVDFNEPLEGLLKRLHKLRAPDGKYVLADEDGKQHDPARLYAFIHVVRERQGLPELTPHLLRHFFASMCIMSGVDLPTVADWLGHNDKGVTLAKTYAHLLNGHKQAQAARVSFQNQTPLHDLGVGAQELPVIAASEKAVEFGTEARD
jgi:integrase